MLRSLNGVQISASKFGGFARRFWSRLSSLEKISFGILIVVIISACSFRLFLTNKNGIFKPAKGGTIIEGVVGQAGAINPLYAQGSQVDRDVSNLVFSGLVKTNRSREFLPDLAVSWNVLDSGKAYIFTLRDNVKWHDGEKFDANDVVFTFKVIQSDAYKGVLKANWQGVTVAALNPTTVEFKLPNSSTFFLSQLTLGIIPEHLFAHLPVSVIGDADNNTKPIGTGPYKLTSSVNARNSISLSVNENYYDELPLVEKLVFYFHDNEKTLLTTLQSGAITSAGFSTLAGVKDLELPGVNKYTYQLPQYKAVFMNQMGGNAALADKAVRQALAFATNKTKIINEAEDGDASAVDSPVLPGFWGYLPTIKKYKFDFISARDILHKNGWQDKDKDGVLEKGKVRLSFSLSFKNDKTNTKIAEVLASDWSAIGAEVILQPYETGDLLDTVIRPRSYDALIFGQNLGSDSDPYVYWHSSQARDPGLALSIMYDKDIDNNLELARLSSSLNKAIGYYHNFQKSFAELVPAILLYQPNYHYLIEDKVKGVTDEINFSDLSDRFINLADWYIKSQKTTS
ncbi:hypothetical protein KKE14_00800 [Patescibacteria group bacterium]|nr:hypothetical protein [Patescibacteria group bacterium]